MLPCEPQPILDATSRFRYPEDVRKGFTDEPRGEKPPLPEVEGGESPRSPNPRRRGSLLAASPTLSALVASSIASLCYVTGYGG